jgi:hypothetical protein
MFLSSGIKYFSLKAFGGCSAGNWTRGLAIVRQVLCYLSHGSHPCAFLLCVSGRVSCFCSGQPQTMILLTKCQGLQMCTTMCCQNLPLQEAEFTSPHAVPQQTTRCQHTGAHPCTVPPRGNTRFQLQVHRPWCTARTCGWWQDKAGLCHQLILQLGTPQNIWWGLVWFQKEKKIKTIKRKKQKNKKTRHQYLSQLGN